MATRIYEVNEKDWNKPRLVEASSQAEAIRYAQTILTAEVCPTLRVVELMGQGVKVEKAVKAQ